LLVLAGTTDLDLEVVEVADRLLLDLAHHRLEHLVPLALVLDERVALGHRTKADAVLQVVHLVEVVAPAAVEHLQHDAALELAHRGGPELLLALLVGDLRVGEDLALESLRGDAALAAGGLGDDLVDRDADRVQRLQLGPQGVEVPVLAVTGCRVVVDDRVDRILDEVLDAVGDVVALQDVTAVGVDRLALPVEDVVVLEDVLADLGVARLDLRLRALDRSRHHARLDRDVVREVRARQDRLGRPRLEEPHEVIGERQVEAALAGVALSTGSTAQLVVDTPRLVPLGAEDVQAAGRDDLFALDRRLLAGRLIDGIPL